MGQNSPMDCSTTGGRNSPRKERHSDKVGTATRRKDETVMIRTTLHMSETCHCSVLVHAF
jgi:hypothetical protein